MTGVLSGSGNLGMGIVFSMYDDFSDVADRAVSKVSKLEAITETATRRITASMNNMKIGLLGMAVGAALLAPFGFAVSKSMEFNKAMSDVGAKSQATAVEMSMLREQALKLGADTKFSATQVAEGQTMLAMAGLKVSEIAAAMPGMLSLAAAGQLDLGRASEIAANTLNQFQMKAAEMPRVADVFAQAATSSNASVESMAEAMKYLGPTASLFKISLEESSAAIGELHNMGLQGGASTRALSTSLANLTKPTKDAAEMMNKVGFNAFDATGNFIGLANMVEQLEGATKNMTQAQKTKTLATLFGADAIQEINGLMTAQKTVMIDGKEVTLKGAAALREFTNELENSTGAADRMANLLMDNLAGDVEKFSGGMDNLLINLGSKVEPVLRPVVQAFTWLVDVFNAFISTRVGEFVVALTAVIGLLALGLGAYVTIGNLAVFASAKAGIAFAAMGKEAIATAFAEQGLTAGTLELATALWAALAPLLPFIAIGAAVVAVVWLLVDAWKGWEERGSSTQKLSGWAEWMFKLGTIMNGVVDIFTSWNGEFFQMSENTQAALENTGLLQFVLNLGTWLVRIKEMMKGAFSALSDAFSSVWKEVGPLWESLKELGNQFSGILAPIVKLTGASEGWFSVTKMIVSAALQPLIFGIKMVIWTLTGVIEIITLTVQAIQFLARIIGTVLGAAWDAYIAYFTAVFYDIPMYIYNVGRDIVSSLWSGIASAWDAFQTWLVGKFDFLSDLNPMNWFGGGEIEANVNTNSTVDTRIAPLMVQNQTAGRFDRPAPQVLNNTTEKVGNIYLQNYLDGEMISENVTNRSQFEGKRQ